MKIRLGFVVIPLVSSLYLGAALANEKQFQGFDDRQLKEFAFWTNDWCRGKYIADEKEQDYVCGLRDESWSALGKRGYCYDKWGKEMFPKCSKGGEPL